jgi:hypothetical protein
MTATSHQALHRSTPLILGGLLAALLLAIAGGAIGLQIVARDQRLPLVLCMLGLFVLIFFTCGLSALRRHRWTIDANAVLVDERPLVPLMGRRRVRRVPFDRIASLSNAPNGADEVLVLTTHEGECFALPPRRDRTPDRTADQKALAAFAAELQAAMMTAGVAAPLVSDGLGFWNRPPGLALLGIAFVVSLGVAAIVLWGLWMGAVSRVKAHAAAAFLVLLPIAVGWLLYRSWQRRRAVIKALR